MGQAAFAAAANEETEALSCAASELVALVIVDAFCIVLSCTCCGDDLHGLVGCVVLRFGCRVFREHLLGVALGDNYLLL